MVVIAVVVTVAVVVIVDVVDATPKVAKHKKFDERYQGPFVADNGAFVTLDLLHNNLVLLREMKSSASGARI